MTRRREPQVMPSRPQALRFVVLAGVLSVLTSAQVRAQCPEPNGNDTEPDTEAIQCLLDQGGTIVLNADVTNGYRIGRPGLVLRRTGTTLTSSSAWGYRALLIATPDLNAPMLQVESDVVSNYTISKIWFYGDRWDRVSPNCRGDQSVNLWLRGSGWLVDDIESDTVPCNTSTVVDGSNSNFEIRNSWFANNGWSETELGRACSGTQCWADGLTVHACVDGWIHDNHFRDNTDVDLVVGGERNCVVENNTIEHILSYGFAGIHVGWFNPYDGDHGGSTYAGNNISSGYDKLGFGIVVGYHPWNSRRDLADAGRVVNNAAVGAVLNVTVEGLGPGAPGEVTGNSMWGAQGSNGFGSCTIAANYTVYLLHAGAATLQEDWFELQFDDGWCIPR